MRDLELARNAAIRAEMHLDAGNLVAARADAERTLRPGRRRPVRHPPGAPHPDGRLRLGRRLRRGRAAGRPHRRLAPPPDEVWIALSARTLQAKIAWEQGRLVEAASLALFARGPGPGDPRGPHRAARRHGAPAWSPADPGARASTPRRLPWAVRLGVQLQEARELLAAGDVSRAAGRAADIVVLADSSKLGRDAVEARLLVADALMALGEPVAGAGRPTCRSCAVPVEVPMPLRAADALDGLAAIAAESGTAAYRPARGGRGGAARQPPRRGPRRVPGVAVCRGRASRLPRRVARAAASSPRPGVAAVAGLFAGQEPAEPSSSPLRRADQGRAAVSPSSWPRG